MSNHTTGAQRRNARMSKIFSNAQAHAEKSGKKSAWDGVDMRSEAMKKTSAHKALEAKKGGKKKEFKATRKWVEDNVPY